MSDSAVFTTMKVVAVVLVIVQTVIVQAITNFVTELGLTPFWVAVLSLVVTALGTTLLFLPQVQKPAGNIRGSSVDD